MSPWVVNGRSLAFDAIPFDCNLSAAFQMCHSDAFRKLRVAALCSFDTGIAEWVSLFRCPMVVECALHTNNNTVVYSECEVV
eukprot:scaffold302762_cov42-Attheya_sp.AAC.2